MRASDGTKTFTLSLTPRLAELPTYKIESLGYSFDAPELHEVAISATVESRGGQVNGKTLEADKLLAKDMAPFPGGNSADAIVTEFASSAPSDDLMGLMAGPPSLAREVIVATVLDAVPAAQRDAASALIRSGVTNASLATAFSAIVDARKASGSHTVPLTLNPQSGSKVTYSAQLSVSDDGLVNGEKLAVDKLVTVTTTLALVPQAAKDTTLTEVGLSAEWVGAATQEQKDFAISQIISARNTPGSVTLDLSYLRTAEPSFVDEPQGRDRGAAGDVVDGRITLAIDHSGQIGGKPLEIDRVYALKRTIEAMSTFERRNELMRLGLNAYVVNSMTPAERLSTITKMGETLNFKPNADTTFEITVADVRWDVAMRVGSPGELVGAVAKPIPPPPKKKNKWMAIAQVVCTVLSFTPLAPFAMAANAALSIASGAKGFALVAAVAAVAGGIAGVSGIASIANTMSTGASLSQSVSAYSAASSGLSAGQTAGAIAESSTAAGLMTNAGWQMAEFANTVRQGAAVAGVANAAIQSYEHGDVLGAVAGAMSAAAGGLNLAGGGTALSQSLNGYARLTATANATIRAAHTGNALDVIQVGAIAVGVANKQLGLEMSSEAITAVKVASEAANIAKAVTVVSTSIDSGNAVRALGGIIRLSQSATRISGEA